LADWVTERNEKLQFREEELRQRQASVDTREAEWRSERDKSIQEKLEAEEIIRVF